MRVNFATYSLCEFPETLVYGLDFSHYIVHQLEDGAFIIFKNYRFHP
jgi:hypothetical protein